MTIKLFLLLSILGFNIAFANTPEYYQYLEARCQNTESPNCCLASVQEMKRTNSLEAIDNLCPAGYFRNMMKCLSSLSWCEKQTQETTCINVALGEASELKSTSPVECCKNLIKRPIKASCDRVSIHNLQERVCLACGDKNCDFALENSCNCPEDCK